MKKNRKKKGFTLIELIVVIAILGILAVIAVPRLSGVRSNAQDNADKATARTIMSAYSIAEAENKDAPTAEQVNSHLDNITVTILTSTPTTTTGWSIVTDGSSNDIQVYKGTTKIMP